MPHHIGRFAVESLLGSGGMGEVYKAVDPVLQRTVAVKTVRPDISNPAALDRMYREAQACGRLQHSNIVTVYEAGTAEGVVFIAMEYLKGESLSQALARRQLRFATKIKILIDILEALAYAHREGVIHRDIKPGNVHLLPDGSVKLLDFGLARVEHAETLTHTSMAMGTPYTRRRNSCAANVWIRAPTSTRRVCSRTRCSRAAEPSTETASGAWWARCCRCRRRQSIRRGALNSQRSRRSSSGRCRRPRRIATPAPRRCATRSPLFSPDRASASRRPQRRSRPRHSECYRIRPFSLARAAPRRRRRSC